MGTDMRRCKICIALIAALIMAHPVSAAVSDESKIASLVKGNTDFAIDLYSKLKEKDGNLFFSPLSISTAFAMTFAGTEGNTATQIAQVLHFGMDKDGLSGAFSDLTASLSATTAQSGYELDIANALWAQSGYKLRKSFLDIVKTYYNSGFKEVDFKSETELTRQTINKWIEEKTNNKITDLIGEGTLTRLTRLVLTDAVYFKGKWASQFEKKDTIEETFKLLSGEEIKVPMMRQKREFNYFENDKLQILEMPYIGNKLSMVIFLPKKPDGLKETESLITPTGVKDWLSGLYMQVVHVDFPKFKMTSQFSLGNTLELMGMTDVFSDRNADFSGISSDKEGPYISEVIHKAYVDVNEEGTEAAAATAVVMMGRGLPPPMPYFTANHPFIFIIRDISSGSILFMGRVVDPRK